MALSNNDSSSKRSQKATAGDLSLLEKLDTVSVVLTVAAKAFGALLFGAFTPRESRPDSYWRYVALTVLRAFVSRASVRQQHYLAAPTDDAYAVACKKRGVTARSEILEDGTRAHWIGDSRAQKLVINFHGGGYCFPAAPEMFEFMFQVVDVLKAQGKSVACLMLSYDLAPGAIYPRQLQQASMLMNHVFSKLAISPDNIILTGDSAGANLVLALLSHISHPHPSTALPIPPVKPSTPVRGAVLISPWVSFDNETSSFKSNILKDCLTPSAGEQWSSAFLGCPPPHASASDYYNQAATAPSSWWKDLQVSEVLIVAGSEDCLIDGIVKFENIFREGYSGKLEFVNVPGEYHDQPNLDLQIGFKEKHEGGQAKLIKKWISSKL